MCLCSKCTLSIISLAQEIDELLGQNLTQADEDAILQELEELLSVGVHVD